MTNSIMKLEGVRLLTKIELQAFSGGKRQVGAWCQGCGDNWPCKQGSSCLYEADCRDHVCIADNSPGNLSYFN